MLLRRTVIGCVLALVVVYALTGCTRSQVDAWLAWWQTDPQAAEEFANQPTIQTELFHPSTVPHSTKWDVVAMCESGGNWSHRPVTNSTGTYSGGLMIRFNVWIAYGGQQFATQAWLASRAEQITVAERILADVGWRAWDCA